MKLHNTSYMQFCSIFSDGRLHAMEAFNQAYEEITGANFFKVSDSINCDVKNRGSKYWTKIFR